MTMLPKVLDMVSKTQDSQLAANTQVQPMPQVQLPPDFQQQQVQPTINQDEEDMKAMAFLKLNGYVKTLVDMAQKGETIETGARFVYDKIPDDLIDIMGLDNWFDLFKAVAPIVIPHEEWLKMVRNAAMKLFDEAET